MKKPDVVKILFGSHLYGLDTPASDKDYKGIYLPTKEDFVLGRADIVHSFSTGEEHTKNTSEDVDFEVFSLLRFVRLAAKGETVALDMLHAPDDKTISSSPIWEDLVKHRHMFYTKELKAFLGYVKRQAAKYGVKGSRLKAVEDVFNYAKENRGRYARLHEAVWDNLPMTEYSSKEVSLDESQMRPQKFYVLCGKRYQKGTPYEIFYDQIRCLYESYGTRAHLAKMNEGIDWKAVSHALRAAYQLEEIYRHGTVTFPLKQREYLLQVKLGELDFTTNVQEELERVVGVVEALAEKSSYPTEVDMDFWNSWMVDIFDRYVR